MNEMGVSLLRAPRSLLSAVLPLVLSGWLSFPLISAAGERPPKANLLLMGGTVSTQTDAGEIQADVLVRDGMIAELGQNLTAPDGTPRIDIAGMTVTPGLIDVRSTLRLSAAAAKQSASDGSLQVVDGVDLFSEDWIEAARQGVTAVYVQPAAAGNLGGAGAVLRCAGGDSVDDVVLRSDAGAQAALGLTSSSSTPRNRYSQYDRLKKALAAAKKYDQEWTKYDESLKEKKNAEKKNAEKKNAEKKDAEKKDAEKKDAEKKTEKDDKQEAGGEKKKEDSSKEKKPAVKKPSWDPAKEFLRKVINGRVPLRLEAHRRDDISYALKIAEEFEVRIVLEGLSHPGADNAAKIAQNRLPVVLGPFLEIDATPSHRRHRSSNWFAPFVENNDNWTLATFGSTGRATKLLRVQAAAAVAAGIDRGNVLKAMTKNAAAILGVENELGEIVVGRAADIAVFAGDPLDPATPVRLVVSHGEVIVDQQEVVSSASERSISHRQLPDMLPDMLPKTYAVASTRILTRGGKVESGRFVVQDGEIAAMNPTGDLPEDIPLYDVGDTWVTPGLMSACADLGTAAHTRETDDADASHHFAVDVFDRTSTVVRRAASGGLLTVALAPGSANVLAGSVGVVRLGGADPITKRAASLKIVLANDSRDNNRYPASLAGQSQMLRRLLSRQPSTTSLLLPPSVRRQILAAREKQIAAILDQSQVALVEANTPGEIRAALQLIEEFRLKAALLKPERVTPFLADLKRLQVSLVFRPVKSADFDRYVDQIAAASKAGIPLAFSGDSASELRLTASLAAQAGTPRDVLLSALTDSAASIVGAPASSGVLGKGSPADFLLWNGSPIDLSSSVQQIVVNGQVH